MTPPHMMFNIQPSPFGIDIILSNDASTLVMGYSSSVSPSASYNITVLYTLLNENFDHYTYEYIV